MLTVRKTAPTPLGDATIIRLTNDHGAWVELSSLGAGITGLGVADREGNIENVALNYADDASYFEDGPCMGKIPGRYANRIAKGIFRLGDKEYQLAVNNGPNHLHGGPEGFDKRRWQIVNQNDRQVLFALSSDDGDQGFPGNLGATVQYRLTDDNRISITYRATVDKPCPVNMTNHVYFNLDGEQSDVRNHKLQILADEYLPVDEGGIPHDGLKSVAGTSFDFRSAKIIASEFLADDDQRKVKGYDHAFLLQAKGDGKKVAAHVWSADEKLQLKVYTTAPALQFYSGNFLGGTPSRGTEPYADWQGLALESEFLPDSPNHPEWPQPDCFLRPGEEYSSLTEYQFIAQ